MLLTDPTDRALATLKAEYCRGAVGLDTFEARVAWVLDTGIADRDGLLGALLAGRRTAYVGRSPRCDLVLADDTVSRSHLMLRARGGRVILTDLGSLNGTQVNGRQVTQAEVRSGDRVTLGSAELVL